MTAPSARISVVLKDLVARPPKETHISVQEIVETFETRGFSVLLLIFCAPTVLPFSPPGLTTAISLPLLFLAIQMILGLKNPWVPGWLGRKQVRVSALAGVVRRITPWLLRLETVLRPRLLPFSCRAAERVIGLFCLCSALAIALPLPFTNTVPSIGIFLMALGLLERDGVVIQAGMVIAIVGVTLAGTVVFLGKEAAMAAIGAVKGLF